MDSIPPKQCAARQGPITDSPWLWVMLFCAAGLVLLEIIAPKFGRRQAQLERQHQGRRYAQSQGAQTFAKPASAETLPAPREPKTAPPEIAYSTEDSTLIRLWPIRAVVLAAMLISTIALVLRRRAPPAGQQPA